MAIKTGLVMEGGAMRGMFTCGVLDVLMENKIPFDGAIGVSAGATFGCNIKSGQIGRAIRYNKKYGRDWRYCSLRSLITTGDLYGADFCYSTLINELDPFDRTAFKANPMAFYVVATDVNTGEPVYHQCKNGDDRDIDWIRASASMPIVSRPVKIDGYAFLDGGIADSIPYAYMDRLGYKRNIIILTQAENYQKAPTSPFMLALLRRYPKIQEAMARRHECYNQQTSEIRKREKAGTVFVIRPPEDLKIKRTENDPAELERVYQIGRREASRRLVEMKQYLSVPEVPAQNDLWGI